MSKIIDITNKLNFEQKPCIQVKDTVAAINNDAPTMLEVTAIIEESKNSMSSQNINRLFELLFDEENRAKINALRLDIRDFVVLIMETATAATNRFDLSEGEAETPATT